METVGVIFDATGADKYLNTLNQVAAAETKVAAAADPAVAAINALDDSAAAAASDAAALGKSADKAAADVDDFGDAAKKGGKGAEDLGDAAEKGSKGLSLLDKITTGAAEKVGHLLVDAAAQAGQAVLKFVGDTIDAAGDFESGMNRFAAVTGDALDESGKSLGDFKDLFISLGRDLPVSTKEVQDAAIEMSKGGIEPATIAAGGLKTVLDLAAAGEIGIAEAAEISANQLGIWVDAAASADEKARFLTQSADLLASAANASTVNVDDLALGLANVGKIADISGLSFQETVQTMALIRSGFSSAADAGTSLKTMLVNLQPQTEDATAAFAKLNLLTEQGTSKFYDANGAFIGMEKASGLLAASLEGLSQAEQTAALKAAFGTDAFRAAAILAEQGADGYDRMGESMGKAGTAAQQAAKRQKGFNVAVDNLMGSVEALGLTIGGAVLPALTDLLGKLASGVNVITDFAAATMKGESVLNKIAGVVSDALIPAVAGATAATLAYAAANSATLVPMLMRQGVLLALNTAAWLANAVAVAAAAAPIVAIGLAVAAVTLKIQEYNQSLDDATTQLLEGKQWWTDSASALDRYAASADYVQQIAGEQEQKLRTLRAEIETGTRTLGDHQAAYEAFGVASGYSQQSLDAEMQALQAKKNELIQGTEALNNQIATYDEHNLHSYDAVEAARVLRDSQGEVRQAFTLTDEAVKKLAEDLVEIRNKGVAAMGELASTHANFVSDIEKRQESHEEALQKLMKEKADARTEDQKKAVNERIAAEEKGYKEQLAAAALAYAEQAAMQRQALGEQLLAYTENQRQMGRISNEQAGQIREETIKHFGLMRDSAAVLFGDMTNTIDRFASGAISDSADVAREWGKAEDAAVDLRQKANELKDRYVMEIIADFEAGRITIDEARRELASIPPRVETEIVVTTTYRERRDERGDDPSQQSPGRASGGPIEAGRSYLVGEQGPEIITARTSGYVTPNDALTRAMASPAQLGAMMGGNTYNAPTIINVDARGSSLTMADVARGVQAGLAAEGREADIRVRTASW